MLCFHCNEYKIILNLEEFVLKNNLSNKFSELVSEHFAINFAVNFEGDYEDLFCETCGYKIEKGEVFIEDKEQLKDEIFQLIGNYIMNEIKSCQNCGDGSFINDFYPSIKSAFYDEDDDPEKIFSDIDTSTEIKDLLYDILRNNSDSWEEYYENIVEYIQCPHCDNGSGIDWSSHIDNGEFDLYTLIYTSSDIEQFYHSFYGDEIEEAKHEISEIAKHFTFDELIKFKNEYIQNRTYISENNQFLKLQKIIRDIYYNGDFYLLDAKRIVFRTRTNKKKQLFDPEQMWEPPYRFVGQGRYNGIGEPVLYCSNNIGGLKQEVTIGVDEIFNYVMFRVERPLKLFPIDRIFGVEFNGIISEAITKNSENDKFKEQYIISNIVSAIVKRVGFNGVVYKSTKDKFSTNYALFNFDKDIDITAVCSFL